MMLGVIGCAALSLPATWIGFFSSICYCENWIQCKSYFYDSMLPDVTSTDRMDMVSSHGYAWGYLGSCIPFVLSLVLVLFMKILVLRLQWQWRLHFLINAAWWFL